VQVANELRSGEGGKVSCRAAKELRRAGLVHRVAGGLAAHLALPGGSWTATASSAPAPDSGCCVQMVAVEPEDRSSADAQAFYKALA
jgi:hypothetical protein